MKTVVFHVAIAIFVVGISSAAAFSMPSLMRAQERRYVHPKSAAYSTGCTESWYTQNLDHYHWPRNEPTKTFEMRYFWCEKFWKKEASNPIFFYAGNEGDVEMYINATGLMWENAETFGALLIFAEHRYYGKTEPFGPDSWKVDPSYLTAEQALSDYATLIWNITRATPSLLHSPVIAFGGSYGGMLAAWLRIKYPGLVAGALAASAPLAAFPGVEGFEPSKFWQVVTRDATAAAGAAPDCARNVRLAFSALQELGSDANGRADLASAMGLCAVPANESEVEDVMYWVQGAFDAYAMGNYPYASSYISGDPDHPLPAWPMRAACKHMAGRSTGSREDLLEGLRLAVGELYNVTGREACFNVGLVGPAAGNAGPWDYQFCTEMMAQELPYFPATGVTDMFWDQGPFNLTAIKKHCADAWGVTPRVHWMAATMNGFDLQGASNIVFTYGGYDPWSFACLQKSLNPTVVSILIPEGAHHLDLMFSHPDDPFSVIAARKAQMLFVRGFIRRHAEQRNGSSGSSLE